MVACPRCRRPSSLRVSFYLCFEHVANLGAYTASRPETGLLIPSVNDADGQSETHRDNFGSLRALHLFQEEQLTGFSTRSAKGRIAKTGLPVALTELLVTGWGGMAPEASGIREVYRCQACGHLRYSGLEEPRCLLDVNNWDGSDFFMIWPLSRFRFVTGRVAEVCRKHSITGIALARNFPLPSDRVISGYSPDRLSYYFPTDRAHALGDPLDIF